MPGTHEPVVLLDTRLQDVCLVSAPDAAGLWSRPVSHVVCGCFSGSCRKQDKDYVLLLVTVFIVVWNAFCLPQQQPSLLGGDCHSSRCM